MLTKILKYNTFIFNKKIKVLKHMDLSNLQNIIHLKWCYFLA